MLQLVDEELITILTAMEEFHTFQEDRGYSGLTDLEEEVVSKLTLYLVKEGKIHSNRDTDWRKK